jgi:YcxB-like protein
MMIQYRITEDDYASAVRFAAWRRLIARPLILTLVAGGIVVALLAVAQWMSPAIALGVVFVGGFALIGFAFDLVVLVPSRARRHYRLYKGIDEPMTLELTDAALKFTNADSETTLPWSKVLQWRQNDQFILIYRMPILFHVVPKSIA